MFKIRKLDSTKEACILVLAKEPHCFAIFPSNETTDQPRISIRYDRNVHRHYQAGRFRGSPYRVDNRVDNGADDGKSLSIAW